MHSRFSALLVLALGLGTLALAACGSSSPSGPASTPTAASSTSAPTAAPTATPTAAAAVHLACPSAAAVNSALGLNVGAPTSRPATDLPAGDTGVNCIYLDLAAKSDVVIDYGTGPVAEPFIPLVETGEKKAAQADGQSFTATTVSGVGSQAVILTISKAGTPGLNGILAVSGATGVVITVLPPASQSSLESFANQLLS